MAVSPSPVAVAFLGPEGTFSSDALRAASMDLPIEVAPVAVATIHDAIVAVERSTVDRAFVPVENSIDGAVRPTLDALAFDAAGVSIVGEFDFPVDHSLIARDRYSLDAIERVISHAQPLAQCARYLRDQLPQAVTIGAASTAQAVQEVVASPQPWAAIGTVSAATLYGGVVLERGIEDEPDNVTRFIWVGRHGAGTAGEGPWRTTLIFSELGADHPGALVDALTEFSSRGVNLTRIQSRPLRRGIGRYMFFVDLEGSDRDPAVAGAIAGLESKAGEVRVLGSYPVRSVPAVG